MRSLFDATVAEHRALSDSESAQASFERCVEKRRADFFTGERNWFDELAQAEQLPPLDANRAHLRRDAFDKRTVNLHVLAQQICAQGTSKPATQVIP